MPFGRDPTVLPGAGRPSESDGRSASADPIHPALPALGPPTGVPSIPTRIDSEPGPAQADLHDRDAVGETRPGGQDQSPEPDPAPALEPFLLRALGDPRPRRQAAQGRTFLADGPSPRGGPDRQPGPGGPGLSVRTVRRYAPARHDRHGPLLRAPPPDGRRTDHRSRRHDPGPDSGPDAGLETAGRHGDPARHP